MPEPRNSWFRGGPEGPARATAVILRFALKVGVFLLLCLVALVVIEGVASLITVVTAEPEPIKPLAERRHTRYDPDLGWSNVRDTHLADFYGPGRDLTINSQGFRGRRAYSPRVPEGRVRAVCVGDSFTLGWGVGDADTWCAQLEELEQRLETVNMGQGGYGIDQAYLSYRRDGGALEADLVIFSVIREDIKRMGRESFFGYGKPVLRLDAEDRLEIRNVPVPRLGYQIPPSLSQYARRFEKLRFVQLVGPALRRAEPALGKTELIDLAGRAFEHLERLTADRGAGLVLVYLPTRSDYRSKRDEWRNRIAREAQQRDIAFVDLVRELNSLPSDEVRELYLTVGGHFNEAGNAWVAETLLRHLRLLPGPTEALGVQATLAAPRAEREDAD